MPYGIRISGSDTTNVDYARLGLLPDYLLKRQLQPMTLLHIAKRIPAEIRAQRLLIPSDPIKNAIPVAANPSMQLLFAIWYEYIEPNGGDNDINCGLCCQRIITQFKELKPYLEHLNITNNLLNQL